MKIISLHKFKHTLKDIKKNSQHRKLCFVVGAGASVKSGIKTGGQLATEWYDEIKERYSKQELEAWVKEVQLNETDLAASYGDIYRKRFENDKTSGYEFLIQAMKDAKPSFGHFVLAQILTKVTESCVITTNFDSLVESSIYQYTDRTPLVCGHESLSGYAQPSKLHPLIVKIHRDLLLAPMSDPKQINNLEQGWEEPLDIIFSRHIPIVIGYGGNDGSLMSYFENMSKPSNFFWCLLKGTQPTQRIEELIEKMDGSFVEIDGFNEMMHELLQVYDEIKPVKEELETVTKERLQTINKQVEEIENQTQTNETTEGKIGKELSAFEYDTLAENETDYEKRKAIYLKALDKYPNTAWLWNEFTYFLKNIKKDYTNLDEYYQKALALHPERANENGNYANFLFNIKKDYDGAEKHYQKALALDPEDANYNGNYASFLKGIKKDYDGAEKHYQKALAIDPEDADNNGNYATFLHQIKNDYKMAEKYYQKALALKPESANKNGNYTQLLLVTDRQNEATKFLEKALSLNKNEQNGLLLELWFYRYAHYQEYLTQAEQEIEKLLQAGIQSIGWHLEQNIEVAMANNHSNPNKLKEFAQRITELPKN